MKNTKENEAKGFYHAYTNGNESKNFIVSQRDRFASFNLIGVCTAIHPEVDVLAFTVEDTHLHLLLYGTISQCIAMTDEYKKEYTRHLTSTRGTIDGVDLYFHFIPVSDEDYLKIVAAYILVQPTKDGKSVMPYDYLWGTASMYFRSKLHIDLWRINDKGGVEIPKRICDLTMRKKRSILVSRTYSVPDEWLVCNGFLLPSNYVNVKKFEDIYRTHNSFRFFTSISGKKQQEIEKSNADYVGVAMEDYEARGVCIEKSREMFGNGDTRRLDTGQRLELAMRLRSDYRLSFRQLSTLVHLPEIELRKYIR